MVMGDSFNSALFKQTFQRVFAKDSKEENFNVSIQLAHSVNKFTISLGCGSGTVRRSITSDTESEVIGLLQIAYYY